MLRWVTDEIMNAVMELSGQEYVDVVWRHGQDGPGCRQAAAGQRRSGPERAVLRRPFRRVPRSRRSHRFRM